MSLLPFKAPTTVGIYGASQSGKSTFTDKLLRQADSMFTKKVHWILLCYGVPSESYFRLQKDIPILTTDIRTMI